MSAAGGGGAAAALLQAMRQRDCPVCGASAAVARPFMARSFDASRLTASSFASRKVPEFMSYTLVKCRDCSTVFASEAPAAGALQTAYHEAAYDSATEAAFAAAAYRAALAPYLDRLPGRGVALEIGTGSGVFLGHLRALGFREQVGIEPSPAAIAAAGDAVRPCIREGAFRGDERPPGSVSLICCFQTLEHVADPLGLAQAALAMLEPGGMLALITHDYTAPVNRMLGRRSPIIDIEHLQLFCPAALRHLAGAAGFGAVDLAPVQNVYPLRYWLSLLPLPGGIKRATMAGAKAARVDQIPIRLNVGNLLTVAQKPP
jgi:SAM-dependent methyltransferase